MMRLMIVSGICAAAARHMAPVPGTALCVCPMEIIRTGRSASSAARVVPSSSRVGCGAVTTATFGTTSGASSGDSHSPIRTAALRRSSAIMPIACEFASISSGDSVPLSPIAAPGTMTTGRVASTRLTSNIAPPAVMDSAAFPVGRSPAVRLPAGSG